MNQESYTVIGGLLQDLVSQDNQVRSNAEQLLYSTWLEQQPQVLLPTLVQFMRSHADEHVSI